ncbi:hypothetical protein, partial [Sansalvadorimonas verongulae]|uniref:hypothetical protein n=1 Tax=Sansalvadorimonas verongulae TaxID=2172824 RepID=UPI0018AD117B
AGAAWAGSVHTPLTPGIPAALAVGFKLVNRIEGSAAWADGVLLPLALGVATDPAVGSKQADCLESGTAGAGGVPLSSTYFPLLILTQYFYFWCRAIVVQIIWSC